VHLGQAHPRARAAREVPRELHVVAEIEGMSGEREVAGDGHEREEHRVGRDAHRDHAARPPRGHRAGREPEAQDHDAQQQEEEMLGPPEPVLAPPGPQRQGQPEPRRREDGGDVERAGDHR
jgi:hypothetical protein